MSGSNVVRCEVVKYGERHYWFKIEDNPLAQLKAVAESVNGVVKDLRTEPPFYQILPCPYCGVEEDRNHDPLKHVHSELGKTT